MPQDLNYYQTFITTSPDCRALEGTAPKVKEGKALTKARIEYDMLSAHPYSYTQEELLYQVHLHHKQIPVEEQNEQARKAFFQKSHACLRASALPKTYGWGLHFNQEGKIALYGSETNAYEEFVQDKSITKLSGMRSKRTSG
ncbi:DUF6157 family protein [Aureibacillus halotolerans]|uniref:Uncharacterized protein n=1 Tax=Aureibacillus halotolerans TaxID=1508390 RepID=A0A4R6U5P6_9BACI|nr:DUF6157 family protein [Aureibacillus halotolerans]TDQ41076.1 hypothetical protein EV213_10474 [Aureibacillus halotolerans]